MLTLAVGLPIAAAALSLAARSTRTVQRVLTFATIGGVAVMGAGLVAATADGTVLVERVGGWPAPFAITFAADPFAALMLTVASVTVGVCVWYAAVSGEDAHPFFHPLVLVLVAGTANAFLTADLFNLFVAFEIMLIASYVLLVLRAGERDVRAGAVYVTTNLVASALFVTGVALVYGLTGTVNFASLAADVETSLALVVPGTVLLVAFGVKAALVPAHGWLARSYPATSPAVTALFSALLTKVGVYALYRTFALLFADVPGMRGAAIVVAVVSMVVGVLGAVGRDGLREILSFHMTSQMGYMVLGIGIFGVRGLAAGIFFTLHQIVVKTGLFLTAAAVEHGTGTGRLDRLGGLGRLRPVLAVAFGLSALSLAGLPPLSGFFGKLALVEAAFADGEHLAGALAVAVSLFTLASMVKIWTATFWGEPVPLVAGGSSDVLPPAAAPSLPTNALALPALSLALLSLALGIGAEWLYRLSLTAAQLLADKSVYIDAVLGG